MCRRIACVVDATNSSRVLKLAAGSGTPTVLPFTGLHLPTRVAVDTTGNVYVMVNVVSEDVDAGRVLKLAVQ